MSGYKRRLCSNCGAGLGFSESDPCDDCQPYVDIVDGLLIPKNQAQSLSDFYRDERSDGGPDIVPLKDHERVNR